MDVVDKFLLNIGIYKNGRFGQFRQHNSVYCFEELNFARQFLMNIKCYNLKLLLIPKFWYPIIYKGP